MSTSNQWMKMRVLIATVALSVVACGAGATDGSIVETSTTSSPSADSTTTTTEVDVSQTADPIETAIVDLSRRLLVPRDQIEVVETRQVSWPDGALGCPEDGVLYTQAIVEGTQVLLRADGRVYDYHAGGDGSAFLCSSDEKDGGYDFVPAPGFND